MLLYAPKLITHGNPIVDDVLRIIKADEVKDEKTFIDFIGSIDKYCEEHNCDYNACINNNFVCDSVMKSSTNPDQEIKYDKVNKRIIFSGSCKLYILTPSETLKNFIDEKNNFAEFAKESFEFCKENGCSFEDYADNIAIDMLEFKYGLSKYAEEHQQEKLLYKTFDKDSKTGFAYYGDNTIKVFKTIGNNPFYFKMYNKSLSLLDSNEKFEAYIKTNKASIGKEVNEQIKEYREKEEQKLKRVDGAISEFVGRGHKKQ